MARPTESIEERFWRHVNKTEHCWLWTSNKDTKGYGMMMFSKTENGIRSRKAKRAHRVSYEINKGSCEGLVVCHKCDNPICVNPDHLFLGTMKENIDDMIQKGRQAKGEAVTNRGEKSGLTHLKNEDVLEIRRMWESGNYTQKEIADCFDVGSTCIGNIVNRIRWTHI